MSKFTLHRTRVSAFWWELFRQGRTRGGT